MSFFRWWFIHLLILGAIEYFYFFLIPSFAYCTYERSVENHRRN